MLIRENMEFALADRNTLLTKKLFPDKIETEKSITSVKMVL